GLTDMGKALDDPSYVHDAVERLEGYAMSTYLLDGFFKETTLSYHNQSTDGLIQSMDNLEGWSDPEGYISPRSGIRLDDVDMRKQLLVLGKADDISSILV